MGIIGSVSENVYKHEYKLYFRLKINHFVNNQKLLRHLENSKKLWFSKVSFPTSPPYHLVDDLLLFAHGVAEVDFGSFQAFVAQ